MSQHAATGRQADGTHQETTMACLMTSRCRGVRSTPRARPGRGRTVRRSRRHSQRRRRHWRNRLRHHDHSGASARRGHVRAGQRAARHQRSARRGHHRPAARLVLRRRKAGRRVHTLVLEEAANSISACCSQRRTRSWRVMVSFAIVQRVTQPKSVASREGTLCFNGASFARTDDRAEKDA